MVDSLVAINPKIVGNFKVLESGEGNWEYEEKVGKMCYCSA